MKQVKRCAHWYDDDDDDDDDYDDRHHHRTKAAILIEHEKERERVNISQSNDDHFNVITNVDHYCLLNSCSACSS